VFSICEPETFQTTVEFREQILRVTNDNNIPIILIGNKHDLENNRKVTKEEGERRAREWGMEYVETSAKTGKNVDEVFLNIVKKVRDRKATAASSKTKKKGGGCIIL